MSILLLQFHREAVTFLRDGSEHKFFIEANPHFKLINIYDEHAKKISMASALGVAPVQIAKKISLQQEVGPAKKNRLSIG